MHDTQHTHKDFLEAANYAVLQAIQGKGQERHAQGKPFSDQPMMLISEMLGSPTGCVYQAIKKLQEAQRLSPAHAMQEYRGAIVYILGAMLVHEKVSNIQLIPELGSEDNLNQFKDL